MFLRGSEVLVILPCASLLRRAAAVLMKRTSVELMANCGPVRHEDDLALLGARHSDDNTPPVVPVS